MEANARPRPRGPSRPPGPASHWPRPRKPPVYLTLHFGQSGRDRGPQVPGQAGRGRPGAAGGHSSPPPGWGGTGNKTFRKIASYVSNRFLCLSFPGMEVEAQRLFAALSSTPCRWRPTPACPCGRDTGVPGAQSSDPQAFPQDPPGDQQAPTPAPSFLTLPICVDPAARDTRLPLACSPNTAPPQLAFRICRHRSTGGLSTRQCRPQGSLWATGQINSTCLAGVPPLALPLGGEPCWGRTHGRPELSPGGQGGRGRGCGRGLTWTPQEKGRGQGCLGVTVTRQAPSPPPAFFLLSTGSRQSGCSA